VLTASDNPRPLVRAIIAELPGLQAGIVRHALSRGGIEVAAEVRDAEAVAGAVAATRSDLVIIPAHRARLGPHYHHLLRDHPEVRLITLSVAGGAADLFEVRLVGNDVGSTDMVDAIQAALAGTMEDGLETSHEKEEHHE
jgi:hypothetical protein